MYGKIPPQAIEIEKAVLGAIVNEREKLWEVIEVITDPGCFYVDAHQRIYAAIISLPAKGKVVDILTLVEELKKTDELELVGGAYYVMSLSNSVVSSAHAVAHARVIMEKHISREIIRVCSEAAAKAYEDKEDVFELLDEAEKGLYELTFRNTGEDLKHLSGSVTGVMEDIKEKRANKITFTGVPTGFKELDRLTGGWQKTDLIILGARPSVGKTAFALNLAHNAVMEDKNMGGVAVFSLEMGMDQIVMRLMSLFSSTPLETIRNPCRLSDAQVKGMYQFNDGLNNLPIYIEDTPAQTVAQIRAKCRRLSKKLMESQRRKKIKETGLGMIIIDYLQLMRNLTYKGNREQEISSISRELKAMAKEFKVPVIALSQLSREIEKRSNNRPYLSDLRESGAIEQDADVIGLLYRPQDEDIKKNPELAHMIYLDIAKNRNGKTDAFPIHKDLSIQKFSDNYLISGPNDESWMKPIPPQSFPDPNARIEQFQKPTDDLPF